MIQIINFMKYDTDKAKIIAEYNLKKDGYSKAIEGTLYRTNNENYFIVPLNEERIMPVTNEEVVDWLATTGNYQPIEKYFPERIQEA